MTTAQSCGRWALHLRLLKDQQQQQQQQHRCWQCPCKLIGTNMLLHSHHSTLALTLCSRGEQQMESRGQLLLLLLLVVVVVLLLQQWCAQQPANAALTNAVMMMLMLAQTAEIRGCQRRLQEG